MSIPSDTMLAPLNHAIVRYEDDSSRTSESLLSEADATNGNAGRESSVDRHRESDGTFSTSTTATGEACEETEPGGFYFLDGGQQTDFAAALRIRVGEGNREWPLAHVSTGRLEESIAPQMIDDRFCTVDWWRWWRRVCPRGSERSADWKSAVCCTPIITKRKRFLQARLAGYVVPSFSY